MLLPVSLTRTCDPSPAPSIVPLRRRELNIHRMNGGIKKIKCNECANPDYILILMSIFKMHWVANESSWALVMRGFISINTENVTVLITVTVGVEGCPLWLKDSVHNNKKMSSWKTVREGDRGCKKVASFNRRNEMTSPSTKAEAFRWKERQPETRGK